MINFEDYELEDYIGDDVEIDMAAILENHEYEAEYLPDEITATLIQIYFLIRALDSNSFLSFHSNGSGYFDAVATNNIVKIDTTNLLEYIKKHDKEYEEIKKGSLNQMLENYCQCSNMSGINDLNFKEHNFTNNDSQSIIAYGIDIFGVWLWAVADDYETLKDRICDYLNKSGIVLKNKK